MFFPCLSNLKRAKFPEQSIKLLDWWLGTRRQNTRKYINPLQFSIDCNIDIEHTLKLFSHSTYDPQIQLLRQKYVYYCPYCAHRVSTNFKENEESILRCNNCEKPISTETLKDSTEIFFELLKAPKDFIQDYRYSEAIGSISAQKKQTAFAYRN